jgi:hypothetical protein
LPVYDSAEYDLVGDLIVPLLSNSREYLRGVGFFTSGWLRVSAKGIVSLIENGGRARVVLSPILDKADWDAFQLGERAKTDELVKRVLEKSIAELEASLEKDTLNCLAWMIADNVFDFRFAIPRDFASQGDYHDKVAVFSDENNDQVAIHGSFNDTLKGSLNGEAFSVFKSWEHTRLLALWESGNAQFHIVSVPEAARESLIRLRSTSDRPYRLLPERKSLDLAAAAHTRACPYTLREYQYRAIDAWIKSGCKGVFEMATGTGKTITALAAAADRNRALGHLVFVVAVPYLHLLEQWADDCRRFGFLPLLCSSAHVGWPREVRSKLADFRLGVLPNVCILVVHQTAASDTFSGMFHCVDPAHTMIVGDEMHRLGSHDLRNALIPHAGLRLGLSATPRRWFDEEGTQVLFDYFGPVCFDYPLEDAIGTFLTPYEYFPIPVTLSPTEMEYYEELTAKIAILVQGKLAVSEQDDELRRL